MGCMSASYPRTLPELSHSQKSSRIPHEYVPYATRILQFLTFSDRPLRIEEAIDVLAVDTEGDQYFDIKDRLSDPLEISRYCSSLVVVVSAKACSYDDDGEHTAYIGFEPPQQWKPLTIKEAYHYLGCLVYMGGSATTGSL
jgi:hypothetical protein